MQGKDLIAAKFLGIYVHVPFCAHGCSFCGFLQQQPKRKDLDRYVETIIQDISLQYPNREVNTIYFGGGTPSVLSIDHIHAISGALPTGNALQEWSVECSPTSVTGEKMRALRDAGVTRITLGIQSFNEKTMELLGRRQTLRQIFSAYDTIRSCEFKNVGLDLIFAIPGQPLESWKEDLLTAASLSPEHISTYNLTFDWKSELNKRLRAGEISKLDDGSEIEFFRVTGEILEKYGYHRYEVSNFSKTGFESIHNLHTWEMYDWIGYGPSASSQINRERFTNIPSIALWREGILAGKHNRCDIQQLSEETLVQDSLIFGLRMTRGVDLQQLKRRFQSFDASKYYNLFNSLADHELATFDGGVIRLTENGLLLSDAVAVEILCV